LIEGEDKVTIKSKEIDIQAQQTLAIESQQDCSLKGMSTKIQTTADMSISAGSTGELKATAGLTVDGGPQTSVKSSAMLELNGGAMATLKGGMVMIN
jgi:fatty acid/phospholipid biosynthesis enzyme